jgi:hypothetical protein
LQKVFSLRAKALYLLNTPSYISNILAFLKTLVKPKQFNRVSKASLLVFQK